MAQIAVDKTGPKAFIIAANGMFATIDAHNDQVWALSLDASETCPFYLHSTYQLRARLMRVFPNIFIGQKKMTKIEDFAQIPTVTTYTPNAITVTYNLINHIQVQFTCFIPKADILVGTVEVTNVGEDPGEISVEMAAILVPMNKGNPTHPQLMNGNHILSGQAEHLFPVLFMSGGPTGINNPYPSLRLPLIMAPGDTQSIHWVLASQDSPSTSLDTARQYASPIWHRDLQIQTKTFEKNLIHIKTGQPDWDTAFMLAQVNALTHQVDNASGQHEPTFVSTRLTDQPAPMAADQTAGSDLTLLDSLHLAQVLLPAHSEHLTRLAESFAARVDPHGKLTAQPNQGMNGAALMEPPLLATLCWTLYEISAETDFLSCVYPSLQRFFDQGWMVDRVEAHGQLPVWQSPAQLQLDSGLFNFDIWEETGNGLEIRTAHSPALAAMLLREALALKKIAQCLGDRSARNRYAKTVKQMQDSINALWQDKLNTFCYQDQQTQQTPGREIYYPGRIQNQLKVNKTFIQPQRLQIHLTTLEENPRGGSVRLEGEDAAGNALVEVFQPPTLRWIANRAHLTTGNVYMALSSIDFEGFNANDRFLIESANYSQPDISCLLPIWSGGIQKGQSTAMLATYLKEGSPGLPETWPGLHPLPDGLHIQVNVLWNALIIEGLVREGLNAEAMTLFSNLMTTLMYGLRDFQGFYPLFDYETGVPKGNANAISGLAALNLCLKIAGIKLLSPDRVAIWEKNPFPWPLEVRWQGLWVHKAGTETQIIFPDGTHYQSQSPKPLLVKSNQS